MILYAASKPAANQSINPAINPAVRNALLWLPSPLTTRIRRSCSGASETSSPQQHWQRRNGHHHIALTLNGIGNSRIDALNTRVDSVQDRLHTIRETQVDMQTDIAVIEQDIDVIQQDIALIKEILERMEAEP